MPLPECMRIGLWSYRVEVVDQARMPNGEAAEAVADHIQRVLSITRATLSKDIENTLIHEALHCISEQMALYLNEDTVIKLANGMEAFMRDNPDLPSMVRL